MILKKTFFIFIIFLLNIVCSFSEEVGDLLQQDMEITEQEKKEENKIIIDDGFSAIYKTGFMVGFGDKWFFEKFDKSGNKIISVLYEKDKLLEKKIYTYIAGKKSGTEINTQDKIIKLKYDENGNEIEKTVFDLEYEDPIEKTINIYKNNLLIKTVFEKDGIIKTSAFTYYPDGEKKTQEDFIDGKKTTLIEYKKSKKIVHIFVNGKKVNSFEEDV